jgi:hypothetical protein
MTSVAQLTAEAREWYVGRNRADFSEVVAADDRLYGLFMAALDEAASDMMRCTDRGISTPYCLVSTQQVFALRRLYRS